MSELDISKFSNNEAQLINLLVENSYRNHMPLDIDKIQGVVKDIETLKIQDKAEKILHEKQSDDCNDINNKNTGFTTEANKVSTNLPENVVEARNRTTKGIAAAAPAEGPAQRKEQAQEAEHRIEDD
jgi:hypothetical protein